MAKLVATSCRRMTRLFVVCALLICALCGLAACGSSSSTEVEADEGVADGTYEVEVTLTGGSGRADVETPATVVVDGGSMTATVVWSSSNYDLMIVDGVEYQPTTISPASTFEIPISGFDEEIAVQAETTAMSTPHMIDYTLTFVSPNSESSSVEGEEAEESLDASTRVENFHNADMGNGWEPVDSLGLAYATQFTVDYYDGGYKLACLGDGGRYLFVPEGAEVPSGIDEDILVIQQPVSDIYLVASDSMCLFDALDSLDAISVSGLKAQDWYIENAVKAMEAGDIVYGGKYSTPDYDVVLSRGCKLAIESTMINHTPEVKEKLEELGIPVLTEQSSYESEPLGRTEWIKFYGAMLNKEDEAQALFDEQVQQVKAVEGQDTGKTVAFFYINSNGNAVTRASGDYISKMIDTAGGSNIFSDLDSGTNNSSVTLEMERFYATAKEADIIIYNGTIDGGIDSISDLTAKNELLQNFKAVQEGNVYCTEQNMYQQMMQTGYIIADFHTAVSGGDDGMTYLHKLS